MKTTLFFFAIVGMSFLSSCKKPSTGPTGGTTTYPDTHTINGGGFKNTVYNISSVAQQSSSYDAVTGLTTITIAGASGDTVDIEYDITFAGNTAGTYTMAPTGNNVFTITTTPIKNPNNLQIYTSNSGAKMVVANYGSSGGKISGTFSGTFNNTGNNYSITNGAFSATVQ